MKLLKCLFLLIWWTSRTSANVSFHPVDLSKAFVQELNLVAQIQKRHETTEKVSKPLKRYMESFNLVLEELSDAGIASLDQALASDVTKIVDKVLVSNTLHIYLLVRRSIDFLPKIKPSSKAIKATQALPFWPKDESDLDKAMLSLARIQFTYQLNVKDFASGIIGTRHTKARLSPKDCFLVAKSRHNQTIPLLRNSRDKELALAIEWAEVAVQLQAEQHGKTADYDKYLKYLIELRQIHDQSFKPMTKGPMPTYYPNEAYFIQPIGTDLSVTGRSLRELEYQEMAKRYAGRVQDQDYSRRDFFALCRGESLKMMVYTEEGSTCRFETRNNPFLFLQPLKLEIVLEDPMEIVIIHDALTESQIDMLVSKSHDSMIRATVYSIKENNPSLLSPDRTQTTTWLFEDEHPEVIPLTRRLDDITGLQVSYQGVRKESDNHFVESEEFQMGLYGPGGVYLAHNDYLQATEVVWRNTSDSNLYLGDRTATVMIYLSDVDGGRTVFPTLGASVEPSKGSAVFWFNLFSDGLPNPMSIHGGCPVLYGTKWVTNRWIREGSQIWKYPCPLEKSSNFF